MLLVAILSLPGCAPRWTKRHEPPPRYQEERQRSAPSRTTDGAAPARSRPDRSRTERTPPPAVSEQRRPEPSPRGSAIAELAYEQLGAPYRAGGDTPSGFDCSGLVRFLYGSQGVRLPRSSDELASVGREVPRGELQAGDLVLFRLDGDAISHVGVFIEEVWFIHAPSSGGVVRLDALDDPYWGPLFATARRP
jgi:cell wall-associated NlpC family hydrolase